MICGIIAQRVVPGSGITSDDTISVNEGVPLSHTLTATDTVEWSIINPAFGGAPDAARFSILGSTLRWVGNGVQDYEDPIDANADNVYVVTVRAVNLGGGVDTQNVSVTVLDTGAGGAILDGRSEEPTSAFSLSRNLIGAYDGGSFYAASSGLITQLDDQTAAGRHLTALTTTRPSVSSAGAMGRACADFNGTANVMAGSSSTYGDLFDPTAAYVIISAIVTSIGTNDSVVGQNDALWTDDGQSFGVALKSGTPSIHAFQTNAGPYNSTTHTLTLGVPFVFELKRSGTVLKSRLNGGSWTTAGMSQTEAIGTSNVISIGANAAPEQFSDCSIFEFVTYDAALTDAEEDALAENMLEYVAGVEGEAVGNAAGVGASVVYGETISSELWTPTTDDLDVSVALWFDAGDGSTITESGGAISQWDDSGAASLHVTQSSAGSKPTYVEGSTDELNGLGYVEFDGGDYLNKTSALGDHVPFVQTTFMVALPTGEGTSVYWTTNGSAIRGNIELSLSNLRYQGSSTNHTNVNPSDLWHVFSGHIGGGGTRTLYVDGTERDENTTGVDTGTPLPTQIWLGSAGGDSYYIGKLGEFVQYGASLSSADREKVEGYLAHKWALDHLLPDSHPYKDEPPYTAGLFTTMEGVADGVGTAAGVGAALSANSASASAAGTGGSSVVGEQASPGPLDGLSGLTGAWSFSRDLLTSFAGGTRYTQSSGKIITLEDQSGSNRDITDGGDTAQRPDLVTAGPSGRLAAEFNSGESDDVMVGPALSNFISNSTGYFIVSMLPDSITLNSALSYLNHPVLSDGGALIGLFLRTTDTYGYNWDGTDDRAAEGSALSTGTAYVLEWWHTGGNVNLRVNGGTTRTAASGNTTGLTETLLLGSNDITTPNVYRGKIFEVAAFNAIPSLAERDAMVAAFKAWIGI